MKIIQITAGTGSFYCGTCLRDNTLVAGLKGLGHEVLMVPLYLPIVTDEPAQSNGTQTFYGGVNVYLQQISPLFRKTPRWFDRIFDSTRILRWSAKKAGSTQPMQLGPLTLSILKGEEGNQSKELDRLIDWLAEYSQPDVVCLSNLLLIGLARRVKTALGVPIVCTLQGEDSFFDALPEPYKQECWQTASERASEVDAFIAVSHYYADVMRERLHVPDDKLQVVHNGINLEGYQPAANPPDSPIIGYLARQCATKGLDTLIDAFILLKKDSSHSTVRLRVAGTMTDADEPFVREMKKRLAANDLLEAVDFLPNLDRDEKIEFLQSLSLFSVPATYGESFGLYVIEALAAGVPVVQPNHAAFPELLESTGGGILYDGEDAASLAAALSSALVDLDRLSELGTRGRAAVIGQFGVEKMASGVASLLQECVSGKLTQEPDKSNQNVI